jgi:two-component system sensor histidine kinase EvgS
MMNKCHGTKLKALDFIKAGFFLVIFVLFSFSAIFAEEMAFEKAGVILSASEIDYPPFSIIDDQGEAGGFSVELMRAALDAMGIDVTFRTGTWAEVRGLLEKGEVQALPIVGRTPERERLFDFTVPYMTLHGAIVVRNKETGISDISDLIGRKVLVMKGDNAEEFLLREDRGIEINTVPTFEMALKELAQGNCDAWSCKGWWLFV